MHKNQGFTLLEVIFVMFVLAILASISAPTFLGAYRRNQLNQAARLVQGGLQGCRSRSNTFSRVFTLYISSAGLSGDCLSDGPKVLDKFIQLESLDSNNSPVASVSFGTRGIVDKSVLFVLSSQQVKYQTCVTLSSPLGIVHTGFIDDSSLDRCVVVVIHITIILSIYKVSMKIL